MSLRPIAVCAILICLAGCYKQEAVNAVEHRSAWQREAGQSPQAAARIAKESDQNTAELTKVLQSAKPEELANMEGKLVRLDGDLADQTDSKWTITKDGWTIVAQVNDLTPNVNTSKDQIKSCGAQGIIQQIDATKKQIVLADVELAPEMKGPMSENVATK
jgi:hypothetical protein